VRVDECAYYVNKLRQNVGMETWIWRHIVTSQTAHTKCKWSPYATEWTPPMKIFCVRHCGCFKKSNTAATLCCNHQRYYQPRVNKVRMLGLHKLHLTTFQTVDVINIFASVKNWPWLRPCSCFGSFKISINFPVSYTLHMSRPKRWSELKIFFSLCTRREGHRAQTHCLHNADW